MSSSDEYLIIETDGVMRAPESEALGDGCFSVGVETMGLADAIDRRNDPRNRAIVRKMPLALVEPIESALQAPNPPEEEIAWGVNAVGAAAWEAGGEGVAVAVLDTGIDHSHDCFQKPGMEFVCHNFTSGEEDDCTDSNGHGTHCAGTIFGAPSSGPRIAVAPGITRAIIGKVLGETGTESSTVILKKAIEWAISEGAHVISMSLGIDFPTYVDYLVKKEDWPVKFATSVALEDYGFTIRFFDELSNLIALQSNAAVIVAAAGNESRRPTYAIGVAPPAASAGFMSVGALKKHGTGFAVARFSNARPSVSAPGVDILSAKAGGGYCVMSGTSMATPHVAGVAALWAQESVSRGEFFAEDVWADVRGNVKDIGLPRDEAGKGLVQSPGPIL